MLLELFDTLSLKKNLFQRNVIINPKSTGNYETIYKILVTTSLHSTEVGQRLEWCYLKCGLLYNCLQRCTLQVRASI